MSDDIPNWKDTAAKLTYDLVGPTAENIGQVGGAWSTYWKYTQFQKVFERFKKRYPNGEYPKNALADLPDGFKIEFMEQASKDDDEVIQELWASLLQGSVEQQVGSERKTLLNIVQQMTPLMVKVLELCMRQVSQSGGHSRWIGLPQNKIEISKQVAKCEDSEILIAFEALEGLGLVKKIKVSLDINFGVGSGLGAGREAVSLRAFENVTRAISQAVNSDRSGDENLLRRTTTPEGDEAIIIAAEMSRIGAQLKKIIELKPDESL